MTARLVIDHTTVPADGRTIRGHLEVDNESGRPVTLAGACNGWVRVGLASDRIPFSPAFGLVGCVDDHLPIGVSQTPVVIDTTYQSCLQDPPAEGDHTPRCTGPHHDGMPSLPAGRYRTAVVFHEVRGPISPPRPSTVRLTKQ